MSPKSTTDRTTGRTRSDKRELWANAASFALFPLGMRSGVLQSVFDVIPAARHAQTRSIPVIVLHGYAANMSLNIRIHTGLRQAGHSRVFSLNYLPFDGEGVPSVARRLVQFVDEVCRATGSKEVHLVGHSAGGIVIREAVCRLGLINVVSVTTIASPHNGSAYGRLGLILAGQGPLKFAAQLRPGSGYLQGLNQEKLPSHIRWFAYQAGIDTIVPAASAELDQEGATNVLFPQDGHISLMLSRSMLHTLTGHIQEAEDAFLVDQAGTA